MNRNKKTFTFILSFILFLSPIAYKVSAQIIPSAGGSGSSNDPYIISTCLELQDIESDLDAYYKLDQDIDCSATTGWNSGDGFEPIGTSGSEFTGNFDGNSFTIDSLFIDRSSTDRVGLFGSASGANIKNITLSNVDITGKEEVGIIGRAESSSIIKNVTSSGDVSGTLEVGGIVGFLFNESEIHFSSSTVNVTSTGGTVGGLVGAMVNTSKMTYSTANGTVDGTAGNGVGGAVGVVSNLNQINNSFAYGDVSSTGNSVGGFAGDVTSLSNIERVRAGGEVNGADSVGGVIGSASTSSIVTKSIGTGDITSSGQYLGGFIGYLDDSEVSNSYAQGDVNTDGESYGGFVGTVTGGGEVNNSYSIGSVSDTGNFFDGFDGPIISGTVNYSYWNSDTGGIPIGPGTNSLTTAEMKNIETFTTELGVNAWDFDTTWSLQSDVNDGYPFLNWETDGDQDSISNTAEIAGPNGGDANYDGILDASQSEVTSYLNPTTGEYTVLSVGAIGETCSITSLENVDESENEVQDIAFIYPYGLIDFVVECGNNGVTITVDLIYYGEIQETEHFLRKYNKTEKTYSAGPVSGATVGSFEGNGNLQRIETYLVTDGGEFDEDGTSNGIIVDPVGLAQAIISSPNTGFGGHEIKK